MNRNNITELYGIRNLPEVYFCDENGNIIYYVEYTKIVKLKQKDKTKWIGKITAPIGNLESWFKIFNDASIKTIYLRGDERSCETGKDVFYAIAINEPEFKNNCFLLKPDGYFGFEILFEFKINNLEIVEDINSPKIIKTFHDNGKINIDYIKPEKTFDEIKTNKIKNRLKELKDSYNKKNIRGTYQK